MRIFNVLFDIRKGLGPDSFEKVIVVAFDDIPEDMEEVDIISMAKKEAETRLYSSEDYPLYGKNWILKEIYDG